MEEEFLDLEALEALLDHDDDGDENQDNFEGTKSGLSNKSEAEPRSQDNLYRTASDSEDDDKLVMACDEEEERAPINGSTSGQGFSSSAQQCFESVANHTNGCRDSSSPFNNGSKSLDVKTRAAKDKGVNQHESHQHFTVESSINPTTKALQEQMAVMQKKMQEMQKLLEIQMQSEKEEVKTPMKEKSTLSISKDSNVQKIRNFDKEEKTRSKPQICSSGKIFQEQIGKNLQENCHKPAKQAIKLISDSGDSPFFDKSLSKSKSTAAMHASNTNGKREKNRDKEENSLTAKKRKLLMKEKERALFGDSDSDWEDLGGEEKHSLNEAGQELKRIMNSRDSVRVAHTPKFGAADLSIGVTSSWQRYYSEAEGDASKRQKGPEKHVKNALQCKSSSSDQAKPKASVEEEKSVTEDFSRIRIVNPLISSSLMKMRMEGRKLISIPKIHLKMNSADMQGDWVTIGVIVEKSDAKTSSTGKPYSIWKLNNLEDMDNSVSFFLFGEVYKQLWKTELGTVIGVLNPGMMESTAKSGGEPAFTIKNPSQLMVMGQSKDLAWCTSRTKGGNKCCKFINRRQGDFCAYHVQAAYRKTSATRLELHGSITGVKPKSFEKKIFSKDCVYMYAGQTFVPNSRVDNDKAKKSVTLSRLQQSVKEGRFQKVNTLSLNDIKPQQMSSKGPNSHKIKEESDDTFLDMLAVPSPGSMNLVAHIKGQKGSFGAREEVVKNRTSSAIAAFPQVQSISAKDLIKQHRQEMADKRLALKQEPRNPLEIMPKLGKGLDSDKEIFLGARRQSAPKADINKLKAIAAIRQKGGLQRPDPNMLKKSCDELKEKVKQRLDKGTPDPTLTAKTKRGRDDPIKISNRTEPPKKRSKLLGDVDINSHEVQSILKAKSKHKGVLAEAEAEREEAYFTELEKKEKMEEKVQSTTSIEITVVTCKVCMYTAQSAKDSCKKEGHTLKRSKAKKRFFMCKKCKHRTYVIDAKFPTEACRKCGALSYEKTSICPVRSGPKLESEILSLRGDEVKYINSLDQKVYLNTVIDD